MNNSDKPAMPISLAVTNDGELYKSINYDEGGGLTKREEFAGRAMQEILAGDGIFKDTKPEKIAKASRIMADALLEELEK